MPIDLRTKHISGSDLLIFAGGAELSELGWLWRFLAGGWRHARPRTDSTYHICLIILVGVFTVGSSAVAQDTIPINDARICTTCRIELDHLVTLAGGDSVPLSHYSKVVRVGEVYVVGPTFVRGQVAVFDTAGSLQLTFGRSGSGPGEFRTSSFKIAPGPGDTLHVVDHNRWLVFAGPSFGFSRMVALQSTPTFFVITENGQMLATFPWQTGSGRLFAVNLINPGNGEVVRSFDPPSNDEMTTVIGSLRMIHATDGAIWTVPLNRIRVLRESVDAAPQNRTWLRREGWFQPWSEYNPNEPFFVRPRPHMVGVRDHPAGFITYATVADRAWTPHVAPDLPAGAERPRVTDFDPNAVFDGVVEVTDLNGATVARALFDFVPRPVAGSSTLVQRTRELTDGSIVLDVYRVRLIGAEGRVRPREASDVASAPTMTSTHRVLFFDAVQSISRGLAPSSRQAVAAICGPGRPAPPVPVVRNRHNKPLLKLRMNPRNSLQ